jgi:hypothetical protein
MMVLEQQVLVLNRQWQAINVIAVQAALSMMAADAATGMDFSDGNFIPVKWSDWLNLPVRDGDGCVSTQPESPSAEGYHRGEVQQGSAEASTAYDETFEGARRRALRLY